MVITKLNQMYDQLQSFKKKKLVVVWANDAHSIEAVSKAIDLQIIDGILVGDQSVIEKICLQGNIDVSKFKIIHAETDICAANKAVELIVNNEGDILMKGLLSTDKFMRAILNKDAGITTPAGILSHVTVIESAFYHKLLIVGDVAIIPNPGIKQKIAIANSLVQTSKSLGIKKPKLAIISVSEQVLPGIHSSVDASILSKMGDRGQLGDIIVDGPLSLDVSINSEVAKVKNVNSKVAGNADCLLFPNLDAGNIFYKTITNLSKANMAAFLAGAKIPCVLSSRGDSTETKLNSIALCALLSNKK